MAGKGGGAWKVAYADFVTAMMAFFLVMWITAQNDNVKEAVAEHFNNPSFTSDPSKNSKSSSKAAMNRNSSNSEKPVSRLETNHGGQSAPIGIVIHFQEYRAELDTESRTRLEQFVPQILGKPQKIEVRGHTTRRPLPPESPYQDAWQLSYARCLAVMTFLEQNGIPPERIRLSQAGGYEPNTIQLKPDWEVNHSRVEVRMLRELVQDYVVTHD